MGMSSYFYGYYQDIELSIELQIELELWKDQNSQSQHEDLLAVVSVGALRGKKNHLTPTSVRECWLARSAPLARLERA